eukprot:scaffold35443_cov32-Tisochrysis_lutea.AAC.1
MRPTTSWPWLKWLPDGVMLTAMMKPTRAKSTPNAVSAACSLNQPPAASAKRQPMEAARAPGKKRPKANTMQMPWARCFVMSGSWLGRLRLLPPDGTGGAGENDALGVGDGGGRGDAANAGAEGDVGEVGSSGAGDGGGPGFRTGGGSSTDDGGGAGAGDGGGCGLKVGGGDGGNGGGLELKVGVGARGDGDGGSSGVGEGSGLEFKVGGVGAGGDGD